MHLSSKTPKNFKDCALSISLLLVCYSVYKSGVLSALLWLWKREYLVFFTFKENLLKIKHF